MSTIQIHVIVPSSARYNLAAPKDFRVMDVNRNCRSPIKVECGGARGCSCHVLSDNNWTD